MVTLNGKPILAHLVQSYIDNGFREFILCTGYLGDMIQDFFADNSFDGYFEFSDAGDDASMLARLYEAKDLMSENVFVVYGDTLIDVDLSKMLSQHLINNASITMTVASVRSPFGLVTVDSDNWVKTFEEKPIQSYYLGQMIVNRETLNEIEPELLNLPDGDGLVHLFSKLSAEQKMRVYPYSGPQITFNTNQELLQAERDIITFFTHQEKSR